MNKTDSSTTFNTPINDKIEVDNLSDTSSTQQNQYLYDFFKGSLNDIKTLETNLEKINIELQDLRNELEKTKDFYNSISKLSNITRIVICILILLPNLKTGESFWRIAKSFIHRAVKKLCFIFIRAVLLK